MAEYFSRDARRWPADRRESRPLVVSLAFEDPAAWYVAPLKQAWRTLFSTGYIAEHGERLVLASDDERPDAVLSFHEELHAETGDKGLAYELSFATSPDRWPGWFSVEE